MIVMCLTINTYLVFIPKSGTELLQLLKFLWVRVLKMPCYIDEVTLEPR